ncbi:MAG: hypothetical protein Q7U92_14795 [Bradyrhizobium sp.]|nr:hypothetical protein [Bradyrhizobium sp.]
MTVPAPAPCKRRLQILDDETRDATRFDPGAHVEMSASEDAWVRDFMVRLAASVRNLGRGQ